MKPSSNQDTIKSAKQGEEAAWKILYNEYYPFLYADALRFHGNTPFAKDAVQEAFLLAYLNFHQLKEPAAFKSWLKKILRHYCYRNRSFAHNIIDVLALNPDHSWENEIERKCELLYEQSKIFQLIAQLSEPLRCTLLLRYFSAFQSYEQIATILCVPVGTIRSRLNEAKSKIAASWENDKGVSEEFYRHSEEWNAFYHHHFTGMYESEGARQRLIQHFEKKIEITFTSGKVGAGRNYLEHEIENDLYYGSRYQPTNIVSCDNISIVEGTNFNSPEFPARCPANSVFVLFREKGRVQRLNLYDSPQ